MNFKHSLLIDDGYIQNSYQALNLKKIILKTNIELRMLRKKINLLEEPDRTTGLVSTHLNLNKSRRIRA